MEDFLEDLKNRPRPNLFRRVYLWWEHDGKYLHKDIKWGIQNLIYWIPTVWRDRNWDGNYIYEILKHKLKAQADYIGKRNIHTRAQYDARNMRICIKLIEKLQDDYYEMEYTDYAKDKHWFEPCKDQPGYSTWESENVWEEYDQYFRKYPLIHQRVLKGEGVFGLDGKNEEDIKQRVAMNIAHINQKRAHKLLFKIMESQIQGWWD